MTDEFAALLKEIERKQKAASKACSTVSELIKKRDQLCTHEYIEEKEHYVEGGYLNTDYTQYWNQCKCCGAKSVITVKYHGNFS